MRLPLLFVLAAALAMPFRASAAMGDHDEFEQALSSFHSGDYARSGRLMVDLAQRYPRVRADAALSFYLQGDLDEAYRQGSLAVTESPGYIHAHLILSDVEVKMGLFDEATTEAQIALSLMPAASAERGGAHMTLGLIKYMRGDLIGSSEEDTSALTFPMDDGNVAISWFNKSANDVLLGNFSDARANLSRAIEVNPGMTIAYLGEAAVEDLGGNDELSAKLAKQSVEMSSWEKDSKDQFYVWPEIRFHWTGLRQEALGNHQQAVEAWTGMQSIECAGGLHTPIYKGRAEAHLARLGVTASCAVTAVAVAKPVTDLELATEGEQAVTPVPAAVESTDSAADHLRLAVLARVEKQWELAQSEYEQSLLIEPANATAHQGLGAVQLMLGNVSGARTSFELALRHAVSPQAVSDALSDLAFIDVAEGKLADAEQKLNQAIDAAPDNPRPYLGLASLYRNTGRADWAPMLEKQAQALDK